MKVRLISVLSLICLFLTGCDRNSDELYNAIVEEGNMVLDMEEARQLMITKYGIQEQDLKGVDCISFVNQYKLYEEGNNIELIKNIFERRKKEFPDNGISSIYCFLDTEGSRLLEPDFNIRKIGIRYNYGVELINVVLDKEKNVFYVNDTTAHELPLTPIFIDIFSVCDWQKKVQVPCEGTTASYGYRVVCQLEDNTYCTYSGFVQDRKDLPIGYFEIEQDVRLILDSIR